MHPTKKAMAMASRILLLALGMAILTTLDAPSVRAQAVAVGPAPGSTPIMSPYLDLLRIDGGVLPNYQQFVRPRILLRDRLNRQQRSIEQESRRVRAINRRVATLQDSSELTTGVRTGFQQFSTFYPALQQR